MNIQSLLMGAFVVGLAVEGAYKGYKYLKRRAAEAKNERRKSAVYPELLENALENPPVGEPGEGTPISGSGCEVE